MFRPQSASSLQPCHCGCRLRVVMPLLWLCYVTVLVGLVPVLCSKVDGFVSCDGCSSKHGRLEQKQHIRIREAVNDTASASGSHGLTHIPLLGDTESASERHRFCSAETHIPLRTGETNVPLLGDTDSWVDPQNPYLLFTSEVDSYPAGIQQKVMGNTKHLKQHQRSPPRNPSPRRSKVCRLGRPLPYPLRY